ncbi:MAG: P-type DNA transfer ATPase VirB11 [Pseudomonadota bacterium]
MSEAILRPAALDEDDARDVYLKSFLQPFARWLHDHDTMEIMVNRPGEVWIETAGADAMTRAEDPAITDQLLQRLATQIARVSHQAVNRENPLLAATLPGGERVQIVAPPAAGDSWVLSIRRHVVADLNLADFAGREGFQSVAIQKPDGLSEADQKLAALLKGRHIDAFLSSAVKTRKTILISGGTSTGKTSLLNALLREVHAGERIVTVEDSREVRLVQPNSVNLVAVKGVMGEARIEVTDLLQAALRLRPDRIILGEVRGPEASTFLRAINTGHPGSISTVHADSPEGALEQLALMILQAGLGLSRSETIDYILSIVDVIVQLRRKNGRRVIERVFFKPMESQF